MPKKKPSNEQSFWERLANFWAPYNTRNWPGMFPSPLPQGTPVGQGVYGRPDQAGIIWNPVMPPISTIESVYGPGVTTLPYPPEQRPYVGGMQLLPPPSPSVQSIYGRGVVTRGAPPTPSWTPGKKEQAQQPSTGGGEGWYAAGGWGNPNLVYQTTGGYWRPTTYGRDIYGLSELNVGPGGELQGAYNRYGQPLGTTAPLQTTHTRLGGKYYYRRRTPEEIRQMNLERGKIGPTIDLVRQRRGGAWQGGGGGQQPQGEQRPYWQNALINWRF